MLLTDLVFALEAQGTPFSPGNFARTLYAKHASPSACWESVRLSPFHQASLQAVRRKGEAFSKAPTSTLPFSLYKLFEETGDRSQYQTCYFDHRARLNTFALLVLSGETQALPALEDAIWAICDEYTWCLPAHLGGRSLLPSAVPGNSAYGLREAAVRTDASGNAYRVHDREVDLFSAETASALAEICALLSDELSPVVAARARTQILARVLDPVAGFGPAFLWETLPNNWSAVCAGAVGIAAMYLIEDSRTLAPILQRCLNAMAVFLSGFEADGACTEGLGYWNYGFGFFVSFAERLLTRTGGQVDLFASEKIAAIALFQQRVWLSGDRVVSFSDGARTGRWHPGLTHELCRRFPGVRAPADAYVHLFGDDPCHRWVMDLRNFLWAEPARAESVRAEPGHAEPASEADASSWFADAAWLISRASSRMGAAVFAAKGGHNDEPHNHNDIGTFLLHGYGENYLDDTGAGEYTKGYFGPERYDYLVNSAFGHSVPQLGEQGQQAGRAFHADVIQVARSKQRDVLALDLTAAYAVPELKSLTRTFLWEKTVVDTSGMPMLTMEDRFVQEETAVPVTERFITFIQPEIEGHAVVIRGEKGCLRIEPEAEGFIPALDRQGFPGHHGEEQFLWRVNFTHPAPDGDCLFRVRFLFSELKKNP